MSELEEDLRDTLGGLRKGLSGVPKAFMFEWVGEQFAVPFLKDLTAPWDQERVLHTVRTNQHIFPHYPKEIREEWSRKAQPYYKYRDKIPRDIFFKWFRAARPELADAIMREKHGWAWICEEIDGIVTDLFGPITGPAIR